jgi:hypothetical protein
MNRIMVLGALICAASSGFAHKARVDFDHGVHFAHYKTYSWVDSTDQGSPEAMFPNQLIRDRITGFIEEALAARGFKRVDTGSDLLIGFKINVTEQPEFTTFYDGGGLDWGWGWGSGISTTTVQTFYEGTLVINMMDANQKKLVFQGTSTQNISSKPAKNTRSFAKAVNEIFEKYPPQP